MNTLRKIPLIRILIPFASGLLLAIYTDLEEPVYLAGLLISTLFYLLVVFTNYRHRFRYRFLPGLSLSAVLTFSGALLLSYHRVPHQELAQLAQTLPVIQQVQLAAPPIQKAKGIQLEVWMNERISGYRLKGLVYVQGITSTNYKTGDQILISGRFKIPDPPLNPLQFDYRAYLERQGIFLTAFVKPDQISKVAESNSFSIVQWSCNIRSAIVSKMEKAGLSGQELAIASALVIGEEKNLDTEIRSAYAASGAMHVLSVSGMHIGIVFLILKILLTPLLRKATWKKWLIPAIIILLWIYSFITGLSPCVQRAALMFSFVAIGDAFGRRSNIYNMLGGSALLLLIIDPWLILDVGFQLSYLALIGIVMLQRPISSLIYIRNKWLFKIWELSAVAIAAQIATAALSLFYFHQFPNYFLIANLAVIPLSFVMLVVGVAFILLGFVPYLDLLLGFGLKWSTWLLNQSLLFLEDVPGSLSRNWYLSSVDCWFSYFLLTVFLGWILRRNKWFLKVSLLVGLSWTSFSFIQTIAEETPSAMVYVHKGRSAVGLFCGDKPLLVSSDTTGSLNVLAGTHLMKMGLIDSKVQQDSCQSSQMIRLSDGNVIFIGGRQSLLRITEPPNPKICPAIRFNYLLIESSLFNWAAITQFKAGKVVLGNGLSSQKKMALKSFLEKQGIHSELIAARGAIALY